jgi:DNA-binding response OmpR family regulator
MSDVPRRVLVVEDDVDLAQAIADLLGDEGFDVEQLAAMASACAWKFAKRASTRRS